MTQVNVPEISFGTTVKGWRCVSRLLSYTVYIIITYTSVRKQCREKSVNLTPLSQVHFILSCILVQIGIVEFFINIKKIYNLICWNYVRLYTFNVLVIQLVHIMWEMFVLWCLYHFTIDVIICNSVYHLRLSIKIIH